MAVASVVLLGAAAIRGAPAVLTESQGLQQVLPIGGTATPQDATPAASPSAPTTTPATPASPKRTPGAAATRPAQPDPTKVRVPERGAGTFLRAKVSARAKTRKGRLIRFDVRVEKGMPVDPAAAAILIHQVLNDPRSWSGGGEARFQLVAPGRKADLHAYIASPRTTDRLCAPLRTEGKVSCRNGSKVVLNAARWVRGAPSYGKDVANYRRYLVNHEFGHAIGYEHVNCKRKGRPAPVMMQQTKGLGGCRPNPWPDPKRR
ncbi:hypothetical protein JOE57_001681 [Microlunatus panaciterrae]|uniref:DUF3152 domain-containing protein n=1 Tax=Microlunatus panaciterrae TaxID=400768 RepID=A0ABS2RID6_9ACTN|nr:hypothetical protein [Microlunatus panaciterrae]